VERLHLAAGAGCSGGGWHPRVQGPGERNFSREKNKEGRGIILRSSPSCIRAPSWKHGSGRTREKYNKTLSGCPTGASRWRIEDLRCRFVFGGESPETRVGHEHFAIGKREESEGEGAIGILIPLKKNHRGGEILAKSSEERRCHCKPLFQKVERRRAAKFQHKRRNLKEKLWTFLVRVASSQAGARRRKVPAQNRIREKVLFPGIKKQSF